MNNVDTDRICPKCGSTMKQTGGAHGYVRFHCSGCGNDDYVELETDNNFEYWQKRGELLGRVKEYIIENSSAYQWDNLGKEILDFITHYPEANVDIYFTMALIACYTNGFNDMDTVKYKKCKAMFKATEKVYKSYLKEPNAKEKFAKETGDSGITGYEEYRALYKKYRYKYQKYQLAWKIAFKLCKFLVPRF